MRCSERREKTLAGCVSMEYTKEDIELATLIARADGQIKAWTEKRKELIEKALSMGLKSCDIPTKSGDVVVSFGDDTERELDINKLVEKLGFEAVYRMLDAKRQKTTLGISDVKNFVDADSVSNRVKVTVKVTVRK